VSRRPAGTGATAPARHPRGGRRCRTATGCSRARWPRRSGAAILVALHSERFADTAPAEVWAALLDEGTYLGSLSTFYRLLRQAGETRERRAQATHPAAVKPELIATTAAKQGIGRGQLTLHAGRGSSMTSKPVAFPPEKEAAAQ